MNVQHTSAKKAAREARRDKVMRMLLAGATQDTIARTLNISKYTVKRDISRRLADAAKNCPNTQMYREVQRQRFEQLLLHIWPRAAKGERDAVDRVLKIMDQQAKLLGLNSPQEIQHIGIDQNNEPLVVELVKGAEKREDKTTPEEPAQ